MRNVSRIVGLIVGLSYAWHACVELKNFDNLYRKQQNCPCIRNYDLLNRTTNEESLRFTFRAAL